MSQLCFGSLPMGPLQKDLDPSRGAEVILAALESGVNFIDTAQSYRNYEHIRLALEQWDGDVHIATKSHATGREDMRRAVEEARESLRVDFLDIFHLHAARVGTDVFEERRGAYEYLQECREEGIIGRIGISTHSVPVVIRAAREPGIDVVYPIINREGLGILEGNRSDMEGAIAQCYAEGKRLYAMKVFGGGNLLDDRISALEYVLSLRGIDVISIGMVHEDELRVNLALLGDDDIDPDLWESTMRGSSKRLHILGLCTGCGTCVEYCPSSALSVVDGKCVVDRESCILCGYCAPHCPEFAIRMV
ncbi:MAG: aldo/keto reductase [Clostridia bacterium]